MKIENQKKSSIFILYKGPPRLPILGAYPYILLVNYRHLQKAVDWLCKYYKTDVLGFYVADFPVIVANTTASVKELLNNPALDGKPALKLVQLREPDFMIRGNRFDIKNCIKTKSKMHFSFFFSFLQALCQLRVNCGKSSAVIL